MWILLLKICLLTTLFYSLYHWALRGNTFFRFNRVYLLAGMFIALALPFIPLYYAVPTVSETDLPETAFRIGNIISIEMKVNESVNFSQIGCLIYILGLIVLLLSRMWTVFRLFRCIRSGSKEVFCGIVSIETPMVQSSFSFLRYIVLPQGIKEVDKNVMFTMASIQGGLLDSSENRESDDKLMAAYTSVLSNTILLFCAIIICIYINLSIYIDWEKHRYEYGVLRSFGMSYAQLQRKVFFRYSSSILFACALNMFLGKYAFTNGTLTSRQIIVSVGLTVGITYVCRLISYYRKKDETVSRMLSEGE